MGGFPLFRLGKGTLLHTLKNLLFLSALRLTHTVPLELNFSKVFAFSGKQIQCSSRRHHRSINSSFVIGIYHLPLFRSNKTPETSRYI